MSQNERVLNHIKMHGGITTKEAFNLYGITRLSARIYDLRNMGYDIDSESVSVKNRYGEKATVSRYKLRD